MRFLLELPEISDADCAFSGHLCGSAVVKRGMDTVRVVVVLPKSLQLLHKIIGIPEEDLVKKFSTNRSDQSLDDGVPLLEQMVEFQQC